MEKENKPNIIKKILAMSMISQIIITSLIYIFTKNIIYCIITLLATAIGISSFLVMIKLVDRYIKKKRGRLLFFACTFLKIILISSIFYLLSRISDKAILFFMLGLSTIVISIIIEGTYQIFRNISNGRT